MIPQYFRNSLALAVLGLCALPGRGNCQALAMSPPGNFSFAGDWQCSGQFVQSGRVHRSSWHGSLSADGNWIELTEIDVEPAGYSGHYELAVDADRTSIVFLDTNSA